MDSVLVLDFLVLEENEEEEQELGFGYTLRIVF